MPEFHGGMSIVVEDVLSKRAKLGLRELAGLVPRARYRQAHTGELITLLVTVPLDGSARLVAEELAERLPAVDGADRDRLLGPLERLASADQGAPRLRQVVDRMLQRLVPRLPRSPGADRVAGACLDSGRAVRRAAAYRHLLAAGAGPLARARLLARLDDDPDVRLRRVVCRDAELVRHIGLGRVLALAPDSASRRSAILLRLDDLDPRERAWLVADYPLELTWALHDRRDPRHSALLSEVVRRHGRDAYLMRRALQCAFAAGDAAAIELATAAATRLLAESGESDRDHRRPA
jgi:hypothetical protein